MEEKKIDGLMLIINERNRQKEIEGYSTEQDDTYVMHELYNAGLAYHLNDIRFWPWDNQYFKPSSRIKDLIKAGALYHAEVDRINRMDEQPEEIYDHKKITAWSISVCAKKINMLSIMDKHIPEILPNLSDKIGHLNCDPEALKDPDFINAINDMAEKAYLMGSKKTPPSPSATVEEAASIEALIKKHLEFEGNTNDKWFLQASVKNYLESGKISGSFMNALLAISSGYNYAQSKPEPMERKSLQEEEIIQNAITVLMRIADGETITKDEALEAGCPLHNLMLELRGLSSQPQWRETAKELESVSNDITTARVRYASLHGTKEPEIDTMLYNIDLRVSQIIDKITP